MSGTGYWLVDNPPVNPQSRCPRRGVLSGTVVVHDAAPGNGQWVDPLAVAGFIRGRPACPDCGSYHEVGDFTYSLPLLPDDCEAFQATDGSNRYAWSYSFACDPETFDLADPRTDQALHVAAKAIGAFALRWAGPTRPERALAVCRLLTQAQARAKEPGIVEHWQLQSDRRDVVKGNPQRPEILKRLIDYTTDVVLAALSPVPPENPEEDDVGILVKNKSGNGILHVFGGVVELVEASDANALKQAGVKQVEVSEASWKRYKALVKAT